MKKRFLAAALALAMLLMMVPSAFAASDGFDDVPGHWAEDAINRWSGYGVVNGVGDNQFAPNGTLTRAQAAQVFANLLDLEVQADISRYTDVPEDSWYHTAIAQCVAAGILTGTGGSAMDPQSPVTREELFVMFARALNIRPQSSSDVTFGDSGEVSGWAQGYINALADRGFVSGVGGGMLAPGEAINRASVMSLLDKTISDYANTSGTTVGNASGVVLVVADNVSVAGDVDTLVVYGGSASVTGSQVAEATVAGENASLSVSGSAVVERVDVAGAEAVLTLTGSVRAGQVSVSGESAQVSLSGQAQAASVAVEETAAGAGLTVGAGSAVTTVDSAAANVTISGSGTVETANVSGNNTTVNTDGTDLTVAQGTTGVTENNKPVSGGSTVETQPEQPVTPPIYIPNYYTVTFVNTDNETTEYTVVEYTTDLSGLAPEVTVEDGQQLKWHNGTGYVELSEVTVTSNLTLTAVVGSDDFTAGNGTEEYPYQVANADQFAAIGQMRTDVHTYYEQIANIAVTTSEVNFNGTYDGNGYSISAGRTSAIGYYSVFGDVWGDSVIRKLTLMQAPDTALTLVSYGAGSSLTVSDIVIDSTSNSLITVNSNNFGFIMANALYEGWGIKAAQTFLFEDITVTSNVRIVNLGTCIGMVVGSGPCFNYKGSSVTYRNCVNNGTIIGSTYAGLLYGNPAYMRGDDGDASVTSAEQFVVKGCTNNGTIMAANSNGDAAMCPQNGNGENSILANAGYYEAQYTVSDLLKDIVFAAYNTEDNGFTLSSEQAPSGYTYELVFSVSAINWSDGVQSNGIKVIVPATISASTEEMTQFTGSNCHAYDKGKAVENKIITEEDIVNTNAEGPYSPYVIVNADGTYKVSIVFLDSAEYDFTSDSSVTLMVYAYDTNGLLAGVKQV